MQPDTTALMLTSRRLMLPHSRCEGLWANKAVYATAESRYTLPHSQADAAPKTAYAAAINDSWTHLVYATSSHVVAYHQAYAAI